jgi:hypothetical protein
MPEARHRRVWIRFSDEEHAALVAKAKALGMKPSALIRDHLGRVRIRHREDERQRVIALNRINGNVNMLARWCNIHKVGADAMIVTAHLAAIEREVTRLIDTIERAS